LWPCQPPLNKGSAGSQVCLVRRETCRSFVCASGGVTPGRGGCCAQWVGACAWHTVSTNAVSDHWGVPGQVAAAQHWGDLPERSWGRRAWVAMRGAETVFKAASLLNFLAFLRFGRYRRAEFQGVIQALAACAACTCDCCAPCFSTAAVGACPACCRFRSYRARVCQPSSSSVLPHPDGVHGLALMRLALNLHTMCA